MLKVLEVAMKEIPEQLTMSEGYVNWWEITTIFELNGVHQTVAVKHLGEPTVDTALDILSKSLKQIKRQANG